MDQTADGEHKSGFSHWLRTGSLPTALSPEGVELKFNPWHDPEDGRFTFAGTGSHYGWSGADPTGEPSMDDRGKSRAARPSKSEALRAGTRIYDGRRRTEPGPSGGHPQSDAASRRGSPPNPVAEFVSGVGEGLYDVGKETVTGVHAALTTNPVMTIRNAGGGIAGMIDTAIAAESTPARIQVSRAAEAVANASARDIGRATGTVAGNVALAVAPGAALSKVSALRSLRLVRPRITYAPPQIGWVKEVVRSEKPWKAYNDSATGSRAGQAPTLMRTMADGSKRPVKFDGVQGDYVIDRKWSVRDMPHARAQILRQSEVLAQHRLIGIWEVPTSAQRTKALKLLKKMNVTNIKVKVAKP
jgi:hypothetical protein